ncbi:MAG TPA: GNAT family N-acetyltransferase [Thermoanaerobaculia bacterium]|nr:GNAT family N-acetyltransferase [Thermoanaerobaculia bacterium]
MTVMVRVLGSADAAVLERVAPEVLDRGVVPNLAAEFLADPRHHIAAATEDGLVVAFASGVHYVHPDKPTELWINEVGVSPAHRRRGLGAAVVGALLAEGRRLGCVNAWVLTDRSNEAGMRLYGSCGGVEAKGDTVMFEFPLRAG